MSLIVRCYNISRSQLFFILVGAANLQGISFVSLLVLVENEVGTDGKLKESFRLYIDNFLKNIKPPNKLAYMSEGRGRIRI